MTLLSDATAASREGVLAALDGLATQVSEHIQQHMQKLPPWKMKPRHTTPLLT
ncbi:hypothetical protein EYB53_020595 [Candidatus Chloroploca sp. M-50]|uniref:Transposase n=1 Tax=Candidatus Chloroploca mongolica TaxID=2528176 RepID=A0ABS4DF97_9CHLR|nr:hypothetical protein [Candidatus Chloroploca mongolica]MBP1468124.1 hypothetical protein [Candidatus Chloroploca mongolica]